MKIILRIALAATVLAGASSLYALSFPASGSIEIATTPNADPAGGGEFAAKIETRPKSAFVSIRTRIILRKKEQP